MTRRAIASTSVLMLVGCTDPDAMEESPEPTVPELVAARDLDPDPDVVEVVLVAAAGVVEYAPGVQTSVLGYRDGGIVGSPVTVPGPLIEAKVGDRLVVHFRNELPGQDTTVHWHGLRLPVQMDGNPMVSGRVAAGETFEYDFVLRDAGLFWYHPHVDTDVQLELGLAGPMLVHETTPLPFDRERAFVLDDVALADDGSLDIEASRDDLLMGRRDGMVVVNGKPPGTIVAEPGALERWRIVNASNGRFFVLEGDALDFTVIGWDGGLLPEPYAESSIVIAPGQRYDLAVRIGEDGPARLRSAEFVRGEGAPDAAVELVEVELAGADRDTPMPATARATTPLDTSASTTWGFDLRSDLDNPAGPAFFINDERWPLNSVLEVRAGTVDVWEVVNEEEHHHPFHIHGLFFQVLDRDGVPEPHLGWRDTVRVGPKETVRLAVPYDEPGRWMYHCQIPEHAENGMMSDLMVVEP